MTFSWCCMLIPDLPGKSKAAMFADSIWQTGEIITISFLDGSESLQDRVQAVAQTWLTESGADLTFDFRETSKKRTDIRISFKLSGSWSYLGKYCRLIEDIVAPTMNYEWLNDQSSDTEVKEVVLHEFGHALGLIHEHESPEHKIPWNKEVIIKDLSGPPNNWDLETINRNMFTAYNSTNVFTTPFDAKSIMLYPIPSRWTINGYSTQNNTELSERDIELVRRLYVA